MPLRTPTASPDTRPRAANAVVCRGVDRVDGSRSAGALRQGSRADIPPALQAVQVVRPRAANLPGMRLPGRRERLRRTEQDQDGHGKLPPRLLVMPMPCDCPEDQPRPDRHRRLQLSRLLRRPAVELLSPRRASHPRRGNGPRAAHRPPGRVAGIPRPAARAPRLPAGRLAALSRLAALHAADAPGPSRGRRAEHRRHLRQPRGGAIQPRSHAGPVRDVRRPLGSMLNLPEEVAHDIPWRSAWAAGVYLAASTVFAVDKYG